MYVTISLVKPMSVMDINCKEQLDNFLAINDYPQVAVLYPNLVVTTELDIFNSEAALKPFSWSDTKAEQWAYQSVVHPTNESDIHIWTYNSPQGLLTFTTDISSECHPIYASSIEGWTESNTFAAQIEKQKQKAVCYKYLGGLDTYDGINAEQLALDMKNPLFNRVISDMDGMLDIGKKYCPNSMEFIEMLSMFEDGRTILLID